MKRCLCLLAVCLYAAPVAAADRPNVLLIITDDQGYGDLGCHGNPKVRTPNLDRLAGQSVRLSSFYVSPVCSPTRSRSGTSPAARGSPSAWVRCPIPGIRWRTAA